MRAVAIIGLLAGCSSTSRVPPPARSAPEAADERATAAEGDEGAGAGAGAAASAGEGEGQPASANEPRRDVRFDLLDLVHTADVRADGALFVDLGGPEGAKHTLGGWRTGWVRDAEDDGVRFAYAGGGDATRLYFGMDGSDLAGGAGGAGGRLAFRIKGIGTSRLRLWVNGKDLPTATMSRDAFETVVVDVPPDAFRAGENEIVMRFGGSDAIRGGRASAAVDWVRIDRGGPLSQETPPPLRNGARLELSGGTTVSYSMEVPARAELDFGLSNGGGASTLRVRALRDGAEPVTLLEARAGSGSPVRQRVDLASLGGDVWRLDLVADGPSSAKAVLLAPRVTVPAARREGERPTRTLAKNLMIVLVDTLRADKLRSYSPHSRVEAPTLDRIAREGTLFERAIAEENWTKPSVATLLTSLYPSTHNVKSADAVVPDEVTLLSERLRDADFATASLIANGYVSERFGFNQGWQFYRNYVRQGLRNRAEAVVGDTLEWIDRRPAGRRFFLYVHTIDPHVPYFPPREFYERYDPAPYSGRVVPNQTAKLLEDIKVGRFRPQGRDVVHLEALYDGEISYHDVHFGRLLDGLRDRGVLDETLVVVTADHGEEFFEHGSVGHGHNLHEELLHVPLLVRMPGLAPEGARVTTDVGLVDVAPTAMEALGLAIPDEMQGRSLLGLLENRTPVGHAAALSDFLEGQRAVTSGRYKLIQKGLGPYVYDLLADPTEQRDIERARPILLRHLRTLMGNLVAGAGTGDGRTQRPRRTFQRRTTTIDPETEAQLRALGYLQ